MPGTGQGVAPKVPKKKERRAMPSTRSSRDSESAGDASLRFKKMSRPVGGKVEYAAFTERNLKMLCLRRSQLEVLLDNPEFDMIIRGLYVRIRVKDVYRVVKVEHSLTGNNEYLCGHKETSKLLDVKNLKGGVVKAVWTHVKAHGCSERNYIVCDDTLKGLFKKPKFKMFHLSRHLKPHFPPKAMRDVRLASHVSQSAAAACEVPLPDLVGAGTRALCSYSMNDPVGDGPSASRYSSGGGGGSVDMPRRAY
eukprot:gene13267-15676_t